MKKIYPALHIIASVSALIVLAAGLMSCEMLHESLSSEQEKTLEAETGAASLAGETWYYNGSSSTDMSSSINNTLCISFGKATTLSSDGLSGSFTITYADANNNSATVVKDLDGGTFSSDSTCYYLNMSPIVSMLNASLVPSGELSVQVKVGGFVCNEGSQKGRAIESFTKTVNVMPLYSATTLSAVTFNTLYKTTGTAIEIPVNGAVTLASDAAVEVTAISGSSLPDGLTTSNFSLSVSSDGLKLLVTPTVELNKKNFTAAVTVSGIIPPLNGTEREMTFPVKFVGAIMSTDTTTNTLDGGLTLDLASMALTDDGTNLTVSLSFAGIPSGWGEDRLSIMIDDTAQATAATVAKNPAGTYSVSNGTIDFYGYQQLYTAAPVNMTTTATWTKNDSSSSIVKQGTTIVAYAYYADSTTVSYVIPFASIGSGTSTGHTLRVLAFATQDWSGGVYDDCPASAVTLSKATNTNDTAAIDFDKALSYTIGSAGETVAYVTPAAPAGIIVTAKTASTAKLVWAASYGADTYTLYRSTDDSTYSAVKTGITGLTVTDTGLTASTKYYYKVSAVNSSGESAASSAVSVTTNAFTVSAAALTYQSAKVSWDDIGATNYKVEYAVNAVTLSYTTASAAETGTSYTVTGLTKKTSYIFRVTADNTVVSTATATTYPVITLDGTLSTDEGWTDTNTAAVSTDSISGVTGCDINSMYVTNDETNLYIAVKFASAPTSCWDKYRVTVLIDNAANSSGSALTTDGTVWNNTVNGYVGLATASSLASGSSVEAQLTTMFTGCSTYANYRTASTSYTDVTGIASTNTLSVSSGTLSSDVIEYAIPLADIGAAVTGNTVYVYSAFSESWWGSSEVTLVDDHIPSAAGTLSTASNKNDTDVIDMTKALSYTIK